MERIKLELKNTGGTRTALYVNGEKIKTLQNYETAKSHIESIRKSMKIAGVTTEYVLHDGRIQSIEA